LIGLWIKTKLKILFSKYSCCTQNWILLYFRNQTCAHMCCMFLLILYSNFWTPSFYISLCLKLLFSTPYHHNLQVVQLNADSKREDHVNRRAAVKGFWKIGLLEMLKPWPPSYMRWVESKLMYQRYWSFPEWRVRT